MSTPVNNTVIELFPRPLRSMTVEMPVSRQAEVINLYKTGPPTADPALERVREFGAFDDLVRVDDQGRAHRDDGKFLSGYELDQIAAHQELIREGIRQRAEALGLREQRKAKLVALYGISNYLGRYGRNPRYDPDAWKRLEYGTPYVGRHRVAAVLPPVETVSELPRSPARPAGNLALRQTMVVPRRPLPRQRRMAALRDWWDYEDTFNKVGAVLTVLATAAVAAIYFSTGDNQSTPDTVAPPLPPLSTQTAPQAPNPLGLPHINKPERPRPGPAEIPAISLPSTLRLGRLAVGHDSIWREVEQLRPGGRQLTQPQIVELTHKIMHDNHSMSEPQAERLPVGFRVRLSQKLKQLVLGFAGVNARHQAAHQ